MIEYEALLVTALLDLDPEQLGLPPVAVLDTPVRRASAALYDGDLLAVADALAELGQASHEGYLRLRAGERLLGEGRVEEGVVSSSARSRSTEKSARHASSLRPRPCSPAPSGAPPRRPAATRRSVPLSLREAAEEDEPDEE